MQNNSIFSKKISYILLSFLWIQCQPTEWEKSYLQAAKRSLVPEVDFILIPEKYSIIDEKWLGMKKTTTFNLKNLKKQIKRYGGNWEDFHEKYKSDIRVEGDTVYMETQGTSHFTNYDYDKKIPIVFYGKKYFKPGLYQDKIFQQHIVPTIAELIDSPIPKGSRLQSISKILKTGSDSTNPTEYRAPEVVLTIVIDQGGLELYKSHPNSFPNIKKIMNQGAYFPHSEVGHLDAHTGVGHVAIGTGAFSTKHGIIANERIFIGEGNKPSPKKLYISSKDNVTPFEMKSESLADAWDYFRKNKPVIISQCYAVRAAIGMAGHGSVYMGHAYADRDYVYWVDKSDVTWKTNTKYFQLPESVKDFHLHLYNIGNNKNPWWKEEDRLDKKFFSDNFYQTVATTTQAKLEGELFRRTIQEVLFGKNLHKDGETDLLYITLKATDAVGHSHGWESQNAKEVLEETDRQVGLILKMMKAELGDDFALVLTGDHGAAPLRELSNGLYLKHKDFLRIVNSLLPENTGHSESLIRFYTSGMISLNHDVMKKYGISKFQIKQKILGIQVEGRNFFRNVYTREELMQMP